MAGILPFGLIAGIRRELLALADVDRVHAVGQASSSSMIETLRPLGVVHVYKYLHHFVPSSL